MLHDDRRRAESFGTIAEQYDRARPTYPSALIDDLMADAPRRVVDVGCGTGKAGRLLATRGCKVLGVEIDARMADVARAHGLEVEVAAFEKWDAGDRMFDLVVSGQAWHWVNPTAGFQKAAAVLRPGGRFAVFWNLGKHEPETLEAFQEVYDRHGVEMHQSVALGTYKRDGGAGTISDIEASGWFEAAEARHYGWEQRYSREEWLDQLPTHSDHSTLPPETLSAVLRDIGTAIDSVGGAITVRFDTMLVTSVRSRLAD